MPSRTSVHTLKALTLLAALPEGRYEGASSIAIRIKAPLNYLGKVLQMLACEDILTSRKGQGGGFRLARSPNRIPLYEILSITEGLENLESCFLGNSRCSDKAHCAIHHEWKRAREPYLQFLKATTISDLMEK